jgi:hypothetical protein
VKRRALSLLLVALLLGVALWLWQHHGATAPGDPIAGGDGGGLPRATPDAEHFAASALNNAVALSDANGLSVLLVARHGHLIIEHYADGASADQLINGAGMSSAVLALAGNDATQISSRLWQPLNAQAARLDGCCLWARAVDWLRVGMLLAQNGAFEGSEIVSAVLLRQLHAAATVFEDGAKAAGAEPFAAHGVYYLRGADRTRLWIAPQQQIVVLQVAGAAGKNGWDETQMFNLMLRATTDSSAPDSSTSLLNQLVPGH